MTLPHRLDRTISIRAPRETVFRFFTDSARWAAWWGTGSTIDARPGGLISIRYPDGTEAAGEVLDLCPPERITFSYGFVSGKPFPSGGSRVTMDLEPDGGGTRLTLSHEFPDAAARDEFVQGWRYQLSLFANLVADEVNAGAGGIDRRVVRVVAGNRRRHPRTVVGTHRHPGSAVPRSVRMYRRHRRSPPPHLRRPALHAEHSDAASRRRASLPGHGSCRLGGADWGGSGAGGRHQRIRFQRRRPHRVGHRFLEDVSAEHTEPRTVAFAVIPANSVVVRGYQVEPDPPAAGTK